MASPHDPAVAPATSGLDAELDGLVDAQRRADARDSQTASPSARWSWTAWLDDVVGVRRAIRSTLYDPFQRHVVVDEATGATRRNWLPELIEHELLLLGPSSLYKLDETSGSGDNGWDDEARRQGRLAATVGLSCGMLGGLGGANRAFNHFYRESADTVFAHRYLAWREMQYQVLWGLCKSGIVAGVRGGSFFGALTVGGYAARKLREKDDLLNVSACGAFMGVCIAMGGGIRQLPFGGALGGGFGLLWALFDRFDRHYLQPMIEQSEEAEEERWRRQFERDLIEDAQRDKLDHLLRGIDGAQGDAADGTNVDADGTLIGTLAEADKPNAKKKKYDSLSEKFVDDALELVSGVNAAVRGALSYAFGRGGGDGSASREGNAARSAGSRGEDVGK